MAAAPHPGSYQYSNLAYRAGAVFLYKKTAGAWAIQSVNYYTGQAASDNLGACTRAALTPQHAQPRAGVGSLAIAPRCINRLEGTLC